SELGLDALRVRVEGAGVELVDRVFLAPRLGERLGQTVVQAAVDLGAPSDTASFGERDRGVPERGGEAAMPVLRRHLLELERLHRVGIDPRPSLDHCDVPPAGGEGGGGGGAARARADHQHLGVDRGAGAPHRVIPGASSCSANTTSDWMSRTYWRT